MQIYKLYYAFGNLPKQLKHVLLIMRLTTLLLVAVLLQVSAKHSLGQRITLSVKNASLASVIDQISVQSGINFFATEDALGKARPVTLRANGLELQVVLKQLFSTQPLDYQVDDYSVVIKEKRASEASPSGNLIFAHAIVKGRIVDSAGVALAGTSVRVLNAEGRRTALQTVADRDGYFELRNVPEDGLLEISYVGYVTKTVKAAADLGAVVLVAVQSELQEVVVSYGNQQKREITGAIEQVNAAEMKDMPVGTLAQKLQGKIGGVQINQTTGRPGQGMAFRIRGAASINAGNAPLFVVDGQPITGDINNINPDEIESFSVLKDASATALYGSRAANGVILVTTKRATAGATRIDFNSYYGTASVPRQGRPEMMDATEFATYMKEFFEDRARYEGYTGGVPEEYQNPAQYGVGTDWYDVLLRHAPIQNHSLSLASGGEKAAVSVTGGYFNQQGVLINTGYERYSLRANAEFRPTDRLTVGINVAPSVQLDHNTRGTSNTDGQRQVFEGAMLTSPTKSHVNPDGSLPMGIVAANQFPYPNWYRYMQERINDNRINRLLANGFVQVEPMRNLKLRSSASVDLADESARGWIPSTSSGGFAAAPPQRASASYGAYNYRSWLNENTLSYQLRFLDDHAIDLLAGFTAQQYDEERSEIYGTDFPDDAIPWISAATTITKSGDPNNNGTQSWSLLSLLGRVNYSYKGRYLLSGAIRRDGSSRFGNDRKWGVFPSVSAGWIVSDESFMEDVPALNHLKLRASYGITGNNNIGNYTATSLIGASNYVFGNVLAQGKAITQLGNSLLSWEKNAQFDAGVDIGVLNDRITLSYDYYRKVTDGLLYQINISQASGFNAVVANIGTFEFWGHEFVVNSRNLTGALKWNTNFNISFNRNVVKKLGTNDLPIEPSNEYNDYWRTAVGQPMGQFYGYVYDGVYMTQQEFDTQPKHASSAVGTVRMKDINGDGVINSQDRTYIGNPNPDFVFGMTNDFSYRNFDLNVVFAGAVGGDILDGMAESSLNLDGVFNVYRDVATRWRSLENPGTGVIPRTLNGTTTLFRTANSFFVSKASYLTAKNIALGYTVGIPNHRYLKSLRVYGSVQQAFILTNYSGSNPEVSSSGLNGLRSGHNPTSYPVPRTFSVGINLGLY